MHAPGYADAQAELADTTFQRAVFGWSEFADQDVETAIRLAQKAIEIDDGMRARAQRAGPRLHPIQQSTTSASPSPERALQINPSDAEALATRSAVLLWTGDIDETRSPPASWRCGSTSISARRHALNLGMAYLLTQRYADAVKLLEAARSALSDLSDCSISRWPPPTPSSAVTPRPPTRWSRAGEGPLPRPRRLRHALPGSRAQAPARPDHAQGRLQLTIYRPSSDHLFPFSPFISGPLNGGALIDASCFRHRIGMIVSHILLRAMAA